MSEKPVQWLKTQGQQYWELHSLTSSLQCAVAQMLKACPTLGVFLLQGCLGAFTSASHFGLSSKVIQENLGKCHVFYEKPYQIWLDQLSTGSSLSLTGTSTRYFKDKGKTFWKNEEAVPHLEQVSSSLSAATGLRKQAGNLYN